MTSLVWNWNYGNNGQDWSMCFWVRTRAVSKGSLPYIAIGDPTWLGLELGLMKLTSYLHELSSSLSSAN